jgi:acetyl esterase/lipase
MATYHPELTKARFYPPSLGLPRTLPFFRAIEALQKRFISPKARKVSVSETADVYYVGPPSGRKPAPALLWIHGGGMVVGTAVTEFSLTHKRYIPHIDMAMAFVEYRLAPKHPFPAAMDDCAAALAWLADQPDVDPSRIAIGGPSAGGGLAAGLALRARDEMDVKPVFQMLIYPMIDDRTAQRTDLDDMPVKLWNQTCNRFGWSSYLAGATGDDVHPHAAPSRAEDLSGLPPAWIGVGTLDLFHDEDVEYARRLQEAGVPCELKVVEGGYHGFEAALSAPVVQDFHRSQIDALRAAFDPDPAG